MYRTPARTDWPSGSRSVTGAEGVRFQASNATMTATKETALIANTAAAPVAATSSPAMGGPNRRAASTATPPSDCRGTELLAWHELRLDRCQAGVVTAAAQPMANISTSSETAFSTPANASAVNTAGGDSPRTPARR